MQVAAAVQKQVTRDFGPLWGLARDGRRVRGSRGRAERLSPRGPVRRPRRADGPARARRSETEHGATGRAVRAAAAIAGIHLNAFTRQPFALIAAADDAGASSSATRCWRCSPIRSGTAVAAAHPTDPERARAVPARGLRSLPGDLVPGQRRAGLGLLHAALLRSGPRPRRRYSFTGAVEGPLQILEDGYITWIDPRDSGLYQLQRRRRRARAPGGHREPGAHEHAAAYRGRHHASSPRVTSQSLRPAPSASFAEGASGAVRDASESAARRSAGGVPVARRRGRGLGVTRRPSRLGSRRWSSRARRTGTPRRASGAVRGRASRSSRPRRRPESPTS